MRFLFSTSSFPRRKTPARYVGLRRFATRLSHFVSRLPTKPQCEILGKILSNETANSQFHSNYHNINIINKFHENWRTCGQRKYCYTWPANVQCNVAVCTQQLHICSAVQCTQQCTNLDSIVFADKDVSSGQVSVNVVHLLDIGHSLGDLCWHLDKLGQP